MYNKLYLKIMPSLILVHFLSQVTDGHFALSQIYINSVNVQLYVMIYGEKFSLLRMFRKSRKYLLPDY